MVISRTNALRVHAEAGTVVSREEIAAGIDRAKQMMAEAGIDSDVTYQDRVSWFESEMPVPEITIGDIVIDPLLLVHELTEIDEILKMGLELTKKAVGREPDKAAAARLTAMANELAVAEHFKAVGHIRRGVKDLEARAKDRALSSEVREQYRRLRSGTTEMLKNLETASRQSNR